MNKIAEADMKVQYKKFKEQLLETGRNSTKEGATILSVIYF